MFIAIRKHMEDREEGFTLIELLVVVIIIGILAAVAIPVFLRQRERGWAASAESDARNAAVAVETVYTNTGIYTAGTANFPLTAASPTAPTGSLVDFKASKGVATTVFVNGSGYCIEAKHASSQDADTVYLPSNGTLIRTATAPTGCS